MQVIVKCFTSYFTLLIMNFKALIFMSHLIQSFREFLNSLEEHLAVIAIIYSIDIPTPDPEGLANGLQK